MDPFGWDDEPERESSEKLLERLKRALEREKQEREFDYKDLPFDTF